MDYAELGIAEHHCDEFGLVNNFWYQPKLEYIF